MLRDERGIGAPVLLVLLLLVALFCLALADAANVLLARGRAQAAADAAALAAAVAQWTFSGSDGDPARAASEAAEANGAQLRSCECAMHGTRASVTVSRETRTRMLGVAPPRVEATASASLDAAAVFRRPG